MLPQNIKLVSWFGLLDGGSSWLLALADTDEFVTITRNQFMFPGTKDPGRIGFNGELVSVRSNVESKLLDLLRSATIDCEIEIPEEHEQFRHHLAGDFGSIDSFRNDLIQYIESDRYVEIATNGIADQQARRK